MRRIHYCLFILSIFHFSAVALAEAVPMRSGIGIQNANYAIRTPGSYYLLNNIYTESGQNGISVYVSDVTIDLCGNKICGDGIGHHGVYIDSGVGNVEVKNGVIVDFLYNGISSPSISDQGVTMLNLRIVGCGANGFRVEGTGHTVINCTAKNNRRFGFSIGGESLVKNNVANNNGVGFFIKGTGNAVIGNVANNNNNITTVGFSVGTGVDFEINMGNNLVKNNIAHGNSIQDINYSACAPSCTFGINHP